IFQARAPARGAPKARTGAPRQPSTERDTFDPIEAHEVADPARGERRAARATERLLPHERSRLRLHAANLVRGNGANIRWQRIEDARIRPWVCALYGPGRFDDLRSRKETGRQAG